MEPAAVRKFLICIILTYGATIVLICQNPAGSARQLYSESQVALADGDFARSKTALQAILSGGYQLSDYNRAIVHNSLGVVNFEIGELPGSPQHYRDAESFCSGKDQGSVRVRITIFNNLALYYTELGDYTNALAHYDKAIRLLESTPGREESFYDKLSMLQLNKGIVYYQLGLFREALEILMASKQIKESHGQSYLGSVYHNLALTYQMLGQSNLSGQYYQKSIIQWETEFGVGYYQLANIHLHYGQFLVQQGDIERDLNFTRRPFRIICPTSV